MIWLVYAAVALTILVYLYLQVRCLVGWKGRYKLLATLPVLWLATWAFVVYYTINLDPAGGDLHPIETFGGAAPSLVLLLILIMLHFINTNRWFETPDVPHT